MFDKDGTLFDFTAVWSVWCDRVVDELSAGDVDLARSLSDAIGYNRKSKQFTSGSLIVSGAADDSAKVMASLLSGTSLDSVNEVCVRHTVGLPLAPVDNLIGVLTTFKAYGLKLGVATNDTESSAHAQLAHSDTTQYFDFVCGYDSGFGSKPGPGMLQAFCEATDIMASDVVMVGDSLHDINAGVAANVGLTVGVLTGPATEDELTGQADLVVTDIASLSEIFQKIR